MKSADLSRFIELKPSFFKDARALRAQFDSRFADPRRTFSTRFVWDYWHIPGQYTVLRTPARNFFSPAVFKRFEKELLEYGGKSLGCNGISEPWLSYYVEGCSQSLHSDNPHGPWAYVYSLTPWKDRRFTGGETLIARPELTEYWSNFDDRSGYEWNDFFIEVPALMNQLLVFDPRLPHGVKEVRGVRDPREGRLVIHGWFTEPRPFVVGALGRRKTFARELDAMLEGLHQELAASGSFHGSLSFQLDVRPSGAVSKTRILRNTLIALDASASDPKKPESLIRRYFDRHPFSRATGKSQVTIPILFRS